MVTQLDALLMLNRTIRRRFDITEEQTHFLFAEDLDEADLLFAFQTDGLLVQLGGNILRPDNESVHRDPQLLRTMLKNLLFASPRARQEVISACTITSTARRSAGTGTTVLIFFVSIGSKSPSGIARTQQRQT